MPAPVERTMHTITRRVFTVLTTLCVSTLLSSGVAFAGQGHGKPDPERMCERLGCTAAQKTQIKAIHDASAPQVQASRDSMKALRDQQRAEWQKPAPSASVLDRLDAQLDAQHDQIGDLRRADMLKIHALLTPEQRTKFTADMDRHGKGGRGKGPKV